MLPADCSGDFVKKQSLARAIGLLAVVGLAVQFIPVRRDNPPVTAEIDAPESLVEILRRACYDCHSNETVWPWYSRIAPFSWLVARDVHEGREELNFSTWGMLSGRKRIKMKKEILEEVQEGEMPLWVYLLAHPAARLDGADKQVIRSWSLAADD